MSDMKKLIAAMFAIPLIGFAAGPSLNNPKFSGTAEFVGGAGESFLEALGIYGPTSTLYVTGLTGGGTALDGVPTTSKAVNRIYLVKQVGIARLYSLEAISTAEDSPNYIRPDDYNASTNMKTWRLLGLQTTTILADNLSVGGEDVATETNTLTMENKTLVSPEISGEASFADESAEAAFRAALGINKGVITVSYSAATGTSFLTPAATTRFFHRYNYAPDAGSSPWTRKIVLNAPNDGESTELWFRIQMPDSPNPTIEFHSLADSGDSIATFQAADLPGGVAWAHFWFTGAEWLLFDAGWNP